MNVRKFLRLCPIAASLLLVAGFRPQAATTEAPLTGYRDFSAEAKIESEFLAVPSAERAGQDLKALTAEPHLAGTPEDYRTAQFVAREFRAAGLETEIVPYRVLLNYPRKVEVTALGSDGRQLMSGPTPEHLAGDRAADNPRVVMPFNGSSASGDVTGQAIYGNYCRRQDFNRLAAQHVDPRGKIVLCRYGQNFRGVKVYLAEQHGAAGVLLYSDPQDDGYVQGDPWPMGPWRPDTGVQRGSVQYLFKYPGDPETPGVASTPELPDSARQPASGNQPHIVSIPLSYHDAAPILQALAGPGAPQGWQGGLPFRYHLGPGGVTVHLVSDQDYQRRLIWDVIGRIPGSQSPEEWVLTGNHRDAWVDGAVDPSSGTAALLEAVRGAGKLLRRGWRPRRTIVFCSWDAEEQGLIGSTEWVEQHMRELQHAVAYFNVDVAVSGPDFTASAAPSLQPFVRQVTQAVPSPLGGTVYEEWKVSHPPQNEHHGAPAPDSPGEVHIGDLGSGSDYTPFLQHAGVPSTDIGSEGPYGVYHSAFDDFAWFKQNADPDFQYLQEIARVLGLETIRMADADVLPYDYVAYARAIGVYLDAARRKAGDAHLGGLDFASAEGADARFLSAAQRVYGLEAAPSGNVDRLNAALRATEDAFLDSAGLPGRPWYKHLIYAPGEYTGYAAVALPGVTEAIEARNAPLAAQQLEALTRALDGAAQTLLSAR
ncbi:MAG: M28 family metallopeptidase [Acidobacteriota bacterium]